CFQAEAVIRDDLLTGVQTCALPISARMPPPLLLPPRLLSWCWVVIKAAAPPRAKLPESRLAVTLRLPTARMPPPPLLPPPPPSGIGRASCRERAAGAADAGTGTR